MENEQPEEGQESQPPLPKGMIDVATDLLEDPEFKDGGDGGAPSPRTPTARLRPRSGDFKESDHPRRDDGKFGSGGGGSDGDKGDKSGEKKSERQKERAATKAKEKELDAAVKQAAVSAKELSNETKRESRDLFGDRDTIHEIMVTSIGQPARDGDGLGDLLAEERPENFPADALEQMMRDADKLSDDIGEPRLTGEKRERLEKVFRRNIDAYAEQVEWAKKTREKYADVI